MSAPMLIRKTTMMLACAMLGACASTSKESFYTLNPSATTPAASAASAPGDNAASGIGIAVGPVRVPEIVDRSQLVVRRGATQVDLLEQHRWAQPLRSEIAQAIASGLRSHLPGARVALDRDAAAQNAQIRVAIDISRFDAVPGEAVVVQALWSIRSTTPQAPLAGQSAAREPVHGSGNEEIAPAFARAMAGVSRDIAAAIAAMPAPTAAAK
ncbi:PqiC family protein [Noviherbaspirillum sp. CPCC 100848]|uniref:PqiC family protein n=1 Tax=Noviherbaspirillum album TaxID=3080276 RepID=A0ABU6J8K6_9BURK|nr:PqiC family protein [Noviherbaspirillum sp. CPCC 100848]MEC4719850.1 PqiC family protein [Noviherbaspirillum sp. CPCC 100848]